MKIIRGLSAGSIILVKMEMNYLMNENILEVKNLKKTFKASGREICAVKDLSFSIKKGETLSIEVSQVVGNPRRDECF